MAHVEDPLVTARPATHVDSTEIRADIERTRARMDETFDALGEKLAPGELLKEGWSLVKGGSAAGSNRLLQVARKHPLPAAVIALGAGWLLLSGRSRRGKKR